VDAEVPRLLIKAVIASCAGGVRKRLGVANNRNKVTPSRNKEVKDAIQA